jgi:hypothetical protein
LIGWYNIYNAVHQQQHRQQQQQQLSLCPILMLRPRAWNMTDSAVMVDGKRVSGALLDFAILIFHNGKLMANSGSCFDDRSFFNQYNITIIYCLLGTDLTLDCGIKKGTMHYPNLLWM